MPGELVAEGKTTSTREAHHELYDGVPGADTEWDKANERPFATLDESTGALVGQIHPVAHFQANNEKQKLLKGGRDTDADIVALAYAVGGTVVTMERLKPNAVKVPSTRRFRTSTLRASWRPKAGSSEQSVAGRRTAVYTRS